MAGDPALPAERDFTNVIWTNVLKPLHDLLAATYAGRLAVIWARETAGDDFVQVSLASPTDQLLESQSRMQARRYTVNVDYVTQDEPLDGEALQALTDRAEDVKDCLIGARDYKPSGVYAWHDGLVESIDYGAADEKDIESNRTRVRLQYAVSVTVPD